MADASTTTTDQDSYPDGKPSHHITTSMWCVSKFATTHTNGNHLPAYAHSTEFSIVFEPLIKIPLQFDNIEAKFQMYGSEISDIVHSKCYLTMIQVISLLWRAQMSHMNLEWTGTIISTRLSMDRFCSSHHLYCMKPRRVTHFNKTLPSSGVLKGSHRKMRLI